MILVFQMSGGNNRSYIVLKVIFTLLPMMIFIKRFLFCSSIFLFLSSLLINSTTDFKTSTASEIERNQFDLPVNGFIEEAFTVKSGQSFASILKDQGVPQQFIHLASIKASPRIDLHKIRRGDSVHTYKDATSGKTSFLVYQPSIQNYFVFDFRDSVLVHEGVFPISTVQRSGSGIIKSSLYEAIEDAGFSPQIAIDLSKIFAWQVTFFYLQPDDEFSLVFEERSVNGQVLDVDVKAARMKHKDQQYYAFYFSADSLDGYFDEAGRPLERPFLKAPIEFTRISSRYSPRRFHPVTKRYRPHLGTDFAAPTGTPIVATATGTVIAASYTRANGNYVKIRHNDTFSTGYLHMSKIAPGIRPGVRVNQKQLIGYVGSTGLATGPHVCYRFWKNGKQVDALKVEMPPSDPLSDDLLPQFTQIVHSLRPDLVESSSTTALIH